VWLDEQPDVNAKDLFLRLQESMPGEFPPGQLRTPQRRVKQWRSEIARQLVLGLEPELEIDREMCSAVSVLTRCAHDPFAGFRIDQRRGEAGIRAAALSRKTSTNFGKDQYWGCCPIHRGEGRDAFHVNPARNIFHCFACGAGGTVLDFVAAMDRCSLFEAAQK
jgi:hypothetical protein